VITREEGLVVDAEKAVRCVVLGNLG